MKRTRKLSKFIHGYVKKFVIYRSTSVSWGGCFLQIVTETYRILCRLFMTGTPVFWWFQSIRGPRASCTAYKPAPGSISLCCTLGLSEILTCWSTITCRSAALPSSSTLPKKVQESKWELHNKQKHKEQLDTRGIELQQTQNDSQEPRNTTDLPDETITLGKVNADARNPVDNNAWQQEIECIWKKK